MSTVLEYLVCGEESKLLKDFLKNKQMQNPILLKASVDMRLKSCCFLGSREGVFTSDPAASNQIFIKTNIQSSVKPQPPIQLFLTRKN